MPTESETLHRSNHPFLSLAESLSRLLAEIIIIICFMQAIVGSSAFLFLLRFISNSLMSQFIPGGARAHERTRAHDIIAAGTVVVSKVA